MFSKACEYGIRATIYVARQSREGRRVNLNGISREIGSPPAFTAKILQLLAKNGIVRSVKGPAGGFEIDRKKMARISLSHIVTAIDGNTIYTGCR
jgi:Rrf2 family transcriptional regulator, iron-sulfur cluster assembly transcription factor